MKNFILFCISIGAFLIHIETVAIIQKVSGTFIAWLLFAMPFYAELHLTWLSILSDGLVNPVTVVYGLFIAFVVLSAGWLKE